MARKKNANGKTAVIVLVVAVIAFAAGAMLSSPIQQDIADNSQSYNTYSLPHDGFSEAKIKIERNNLSFTSGCRSLTMLITDDQAFSVARGTEGGYVRPLTHDVMKDLADNMNIRLVEGRIDTAVNDIYHAKLIFQRGSDILDVDSRPSDMAALSVRFNNSVYVSDEILEKYGMRVC